MDFIPAQESSLFSNLFRIYTKGLFKRRFKKIWIHQEYAPDQNSRTVYFLNHTSWWDGLIPFLLNEYCFKQHGRAMMELQQMKRYRFFKWLGAFSINPQDTAHTVRSLRYAVHSMQGEHSSLFIFPEGEIRPITNHAAFKPGIGWLCAQLPGVDFVPAGVHLHTIRHDKPELHLWVGNALNINPKQTRAEFTGHCEQAMNQVLAPLLATAGFDDEPYVPFF